MCCHHEQIMRHYSVNKAHPQYIRLLPPRPFGLNDIRRGCERG